MIGDRGPTHRRGRVIRATDLNKTTRMGESLARGRLGGQQTVVDGIPLMLSVPTGPIQVKTPSAGIPGRSGLTQHKGDCFRVQDDGTGGLIVTEQTVPVWNYSGNAAPGNRFAVAEPVNGLWKLISWEC